MHSSHHFIIGHSHDVCQDYADSGDAWAALSDGCSRILDREGKAIDAHTDIGARILVSTARSLLPHGASWIEHHAVLANSHRRALGYPAETITGTLLLLWADASCVGATLCGDGLIGARRRSDKRWVLHRIEFPRRPFYPRMLLDKDGVQRYATDCGGTYFWQILTPESETWEVREVSIAVAQSLAVSFSTDEYDLVIGASDGAFQFTKGGSAVSFDREFANRLLDFRRMGGNFMVRHLRGVLRELEQDGIQNQDDLSMVAIYGG